MIAIQADLIEIEGQRILNFTKILDIYEELAEDDVEGNIVNETTWAKSASWTLATARALLDIVNIREPQQKLNFTQTYISLATSKGNSYWLNKRTEPKSYLGFKERDEEKAEMIKALLDNSSIPYTYSKYKEFLIVVDRDFIRTHKEIFLKIHDIRFSNDLLNSES